MDFNKKLWFEAISRGDVTEVRKILENNIGVINCGDVSLDRNIKFCSPFKLAG
jgi:hypothetical protein